MVKRVDELDSMLRLLNRLNEECNNKKGLAAQLDTKIKAIQAEINGTRQSEGDSGERLDLLKEEIRQLQTSIALQREAMLVPLEKKLKEKNEEKLNLESDIEGLNIEKQEQEDNKKAEMQLFEETERLNDAFKVATALKREKWTIEGFVNKYSRNTHRDISYSINDSIDEKVKLLCQIKPIVEELLGQKL